MVFGSVFNISSLNGSNGFAINGIEVYDYSGYSVSNAGDINGDDIDDLIIGSVVRSSIVDYKSSSLSSNNSNSCFVVFGKTTGFSSNMNLSSLNGSNGFAISGSKDYDYYAGWSVSDAGDINGDGLDDLIIGMTNADPNGAYSGQSYVIFGKTTGFSSNMNLSSLNGSNGFAIAGMSASDFLGNSVSSAGDVNGDGFDDLIIGATGADPNGAYSGQSYVIFGKTTLFASSFNLKLLNGTNGFMINGMNVDDRSGNSVSSAGDVNGDGFDDLIIGSTGADPNGDNSGQSYIVFGKPTAFSSSLNLSSLNVSKGYIINGINKDDKSGISVSSAGDINGDGFDDLIIGAKDASPKGKLSGQSYVIFGKPTAFSSNLNLSSLNGNNGFIINGIDAYDQLGNSVSSAGDVNGDNIEDLIIGATNADSDKAFSGQSYVIFGKTNAFSSSLNLSNLNGNNGFALNGINAYDNSGRSVSNAGDINGDGGDDLIIGAPNAYPQGFSSGQTYVIFGQPAPIPKPIEGDINNNLLNGTFRDDTLNGLGGNDTLNGLGGNDTLNGGTGNDTLTGGLGNDTYLIYNTNDLVQETSALNIEIDTVQTNITYTLLSNLENLTLTDAINVQGIGNNRQNLMSGNIGNNLLEGSGSKDTLNGGSGNDTLNGGSGNDTLNGGSGNDTYIVDNANDLLQETITISSEIDTVQANVTYTLGSNLENLILTGNGDFKGIGNNLKNSITGNNKNNLIRGGAGDDTLIGGVGNDSFNFSTGVPFNTNYLGIDTIDDFTSNSDKIILSKTTFTAITSNVGTGFSKASEFATVTTYGQAQSSQAIIVYNSNSGRFFYNQNGIAAGFGSGLSVAALSGNPIINANDFVITA